MANPLRYFNELRQWAAIAYTDITGTPTIPTGNVVGPASSIAGHVATYADTTGKLLQDGGLSVSWYDTRTSAAAATIPTAVVNFVQTAGFAAVGDFGKALYKKVGGTTTGGFQSADGQWWGIANAVVTPQMFGDCTVECTTVIQNAIDFQNGRAIYGNAGIVFFSDGKYLAKNGLHLKGAVRLVGSGQQGTQIDSQAFDVATVLTCDATCNYASIENISIYGYANAAATHNTVSVANAGLVVVRDCQFHGGIAGLSTGGVDCLFSNSFFSGYTYNVYSTGASWYERCKIDTGVLSGASPVYGFYQDAYYTVGVAENSFIDCDFSGNYTNSITINDTGTSSAITKFGTGCVFSKPIVITNAKLSIFTACEIGNQISVGTNVTLFVGNASVTGVVISISGAGKQLATNGNYQLT